MFPDQRCQVRVQAEAEIAGYHLPKVPAFSHRFLNLMSFSVSESHFWDAHYIGFSYPLRLLLPPSIFLLRSSGQTFHKMSFK
jgi:hypothetical protein